MGTRQRALVILVGALASGLWTTPTHAQASGPVSVSASIGFGPSSSSDSYEGSFNPALRVAPSLRVTERLALELGAQVVDGSGFQGESICFPDQACRVNYRYIGGSAGLLLDASRHAGTGRLRFALGAGSYRIKSDDSDAVSALGVHVGLETILRQWSRGALSLGIRAVALSDVGGERLWFVPVELGVRF